MNSEKKNSFNQKNSKRKNKSNSKSNFGNSSDSQNGCLSNTETLQNELAKNFEKCVEIKEDEKDSPGILKQQKKLDTTKSVAIIQNVENLKNKIECNDELGNSNLNQVLVEVNGFDNCNSTSQSCNSDLATSTKNDKIVELNSKLEEQPSQEKECKDERPKQSEEQQVQPNTDAQLLSYTNGFDPKNITIEYKEYESENQMHDIMQLIQSELSEPYSIYTYRYFIYNWPKLCFLATHENKYVGAIVCKLDMHMNVVKRGYIAMLAVKKEYRKLKIGTNLVQKAIDAMLADNADEVVLETEMKNVSALRLYENLGFVRDKRLFRYYLNGVDALRLKLWFN